MARSRFFWPERFSSELFGLGPATLQFKGRWLHQNSNRPIFQVVPYYQLHPRFCCALFGHTRKPSGICHRDARSIRFLVCCSSIEWIINGLCVSSRVPLTMLALKYKLAPRFHVNREAVSATIPRPLSFIDAITTVT